MELFNQMQKERDIDLDRLIDRFFGRDVYTTTLTNLVRLHNTDFKARIGTDSTFSTFEKYDAKEVRSIYTVPVPEERRSIKGFAQYR